MEKEVINSGLVFILLCMPALFIIGGISKISFTVGFGSALMIIGSGIIITILGLLMEKE